MRLRAWFTAFALGLLVLSRASAHDFWIEPSAFWINAGGVTSMTLQVGHGPYRQRSPIPARRITRFQAIAPDGQTIDLRAEDGEFARNEAGPHLLVLLTDDHAQT